MTTSLPTILNISGDQTCNLETAMSTFRDYLLFRKFITPAALQILFWAGIGGTLYGTWWLYTHGHWAWTLSLIFGTLMTRLLFESFVLRYQTYVRLSEIKEKLDEKPW